ncbi:PREDICTED: glycerophosphodiester phosphodiesterase GDPDL5 [Tarenaya hassleriana]|uniref:glycerophosphodiester phosphodiesterase GDPDL5 n=1 Tax=Tarenaya hassleriana TaxID=28532 RepID=UPI00053C4019|nr:PREDICTED: glycerophosphodiester phosphodiesterase GDPDL5 [Tarenaya hassleriana]
MVTMACSAAAVLLFLIHFFTLQTTSSSSWLTLNGEPPVVIARGGFSGMFPDSSIVAYDSATVTSTPNVTLWCDLQLAKDDIGFCFPHLSFENGSNIEYVFPGQKKSYIVNGVPSKGWFPVDYTIDELFTLTLTQDIYSRPPIFDDIYSIATVEEVANASSSLWLNIQHTAFYSQHNLSMRNYVLSVSKHVAVSYISSPEISFLQSIKKNFARRMTKLIFRFLEQDEIEPSSNLTYGHLMKNLSYIRTFSSGILVPKSFIWPVDAEFYLLPHTSLVTDAHKEGIEVFASEFANDVLFAYNYSYDPLAEYLSFIDNGNFSVDGILSDYPITPYQAINCFCHLNTDAKQRGEFSIISMNGASGDYPGCTDLAYQKAVNDGVDILDCNVQISKDQVLFCLSSINLLNSTDVAQTSFRNLSVLAPEIQKESGIYTFSLPMSQIRTLKPAISNPYMWTKLFRNPRNRNAGRFLILSEFLSLAKNYSSLSGIIIRVENAAYLAEHQGLGIVDTVLDELRKSSQKNQTGPRILIMSSDISVLRKFKEATNHELVYEVDRNIRTISDSAVRDIKKYASSIVISKRSVYHQMSYGFITRATPVVKMLKSHKLRVYVETFSNEFVSQAQDFFSDTTVEINSFVNEMGIDGLITDFPATAARFRRKRCDMSLVPTGREKLLDLANEKSLPPAQAPYPSLKESDIDEPPLPDVIQPSAPVDVKAHAKAICFSFSVALAMLLSSFM